MTYSFTFKTREEYFAYRQDWKLRYYEQITKIRKAREEFKASQREFAKVDPEGSSDWQVYSKMTDEQKKSRNAAWNNMTNHMSDFGQARREAYELIQERLASRVEAGYQRELRLQKAA